MVSSLVVASVIVEFTQYFPFGSGIFQGEMKDQRLPDKASKVPRTFILGYAGGARGDRKTNIQTEDGQCWMFSMLFLFASIPGVTLPETNITPEKCTFQGFLCEFVCQISGISQASSS